MTGKGRKQPSSQTMIHEYSDPHQRNCDLSLIDIWALCSSNLKSKAKAYHLTRSNY